MRHHIHREDHLFFPLDWKVFTPEDLALVTRELEHHDERGGGSAITESRQLLREMATLVGSEHSLPRDR